MEILKKKWKFWKNQKFERNREFEKNRNFCLNCNILRYIIFNSNYSRLGEQKLGTAEVYVPRKKVFDHSDPWDRKAQDSRISAWAGAPGASGWNTDKKILYPPPQWAIKELDEFTDGVRKEMSQLFQQSWFLELTGDAQRKRSEIQENSKFQKNVQGI